MTKTKEIWLNLRVANTFARWQHASTTVASNKVLSIRAFVRGPVKLGFSLKFYSQRFPTPSSNLALAEVNH